MRPILAIPLHAETGVAGREVRSGLVEPASSIRTSVPIWRPVSLAPHTLSISIRHLLSYSNLNMLPCLHHAHLISYFSLFRLLCPHRAPSLSYFSLYMTPCLHQVSLLPYFLPNIPPRLHLVPQQSNLSLDMPPSPHEAALLSYFSINMLFLFPSGTSTTLLQSQYIAPSRSSMSTIVFQSQTAACLHQAPLLPYFSLNMPPWHHVSIRHLCQTSLLSYFSLNRPLCLHRAPLLPYFSLYISPCFHHDPVQFQLS